MTPSLIRTPAKRPPPSPAASQPAALRDSRTCPLTLEDLHDDILYHHLIPQLSPRDWLPCRRVSRRFQRLVDPHLMRASVLERRIPRYVDMAFFAHQRLSGLTRAWLDLFDARHLKALESCQHHEAFPWLFFAAIKTLLRRVPAIEFKPCAAFHKDSVFLVNQLDKNRPCLEVVEEKWATLQDNILPGPSTNPPPHSMGLWFSYARLRMALLVRDHPEGARIWIHEKEKNDCWQPTKMLTWYQTTITGARWSLCSRYLGVWSASDIRIWRRDSATHWTIVARLGLTDRVLDVMFSPDSRLLLVNCLSASPTRLYVQQPDGHWNPGIPLPSLPVVREARSLFSTDSRFIVQIYTTREPQADHLQFLRPHSLVAAWCPQQQVMAESFQPDLQLEASGKVLCCSFSVHGYLAVMERQRIERQREERQREEAGDSCRLCITLWATDTQDLWCPRGTTQITGADALANPRALFFSTDSRFLLLRLKNESVRVWYLQPDLSRQATGSPEQALRH